MNYYLGEIFVTHRRFLFFWIEYTDRYSFTLIKADNWTLANEKCKSWSDDKTNSLKCKFKFRHFTTPAI